MDQQPSLFGEELRRRRLGADVTLTDLASQIHYSKGQLSKVERGLKPPSRELARLCDAALHAHGALSVLIHERPSEGPEPPSASIDEEAWLMQFVPDGLAGAASVSRRQVMTAGAASIPALHLGGLRPPGPADATLPDMFRSLFDQYRELGQAADARLLISVLAAQTHVIDQLARGAAPRTSQQLLVIGSRYAEFVGWMLQEAGREPAAMRWTQQATELAAAGGDRHLATYGLVRHSLVALYNEDAGQTVGLAQQAQHAGGPPRIEGLAAEHEAQGYALAGDYDASMRALDRARSLLARQSDPDAPVIGPSHLADPVEMARGWCLYDLGRPHAAAEIISRQLTQVPRQALRTRTRFGTRGALAYAAAGEVDQACQLAAPLLDDALMLNSATIAKDLRRLARELWRHPKNPSVRELAPRLGSLARITVE